MFFSKKYGRVFIKYWSSTLWGLVHLLRYIWDNNKLRLKYYSNIEDELLSELLRQASINTENQFMVFYYLAHCAACVFYQFENMIIIFHMTGLLYSLNGYWFLISLQDEKWLVWIFHHHSHYNKELLHCY